MPTPDPAAASNAAVPRPEYPRPQLTRSRWLNLNGQWEFEFDEDRDSEPEERPDGRRLARRITVPFPYQSPLSGIGDTSIHEVVWYARSFEVPEDWRGEDVLLHFGAVDYRTTVWVNGREAGHNQGGHVPFWFNLTPYLQDGENRLTLRVEDRQDPRQPRGKQSCSGQPKGIDYYCSTGIWQTVWLEPVPRLRIEDLRLTPVGDRLEVEVILHAPAADWRLEAEVLEGGQVVCRAECHAPMAVGTLGLEIPDARRWSPDDPNLYDLRVRLHLDGEVADEVGSYFGLREVRVEKGHFYLNGVPQYLAMVLDQGYWPEGLLAAPSDEALRADVEWTKRFGFNGVRKHQKIEDPRWYYWCDRLGLMVWAEMPNARAWSPGGEEALAAEWERAVRRDRNHPCVVTWVPVNESMGLPELREGHPGQYAFLETIVERTRRLDSTRPVIDNDGWEHTDVTDIFAVHDYSHSSEALRDRYRETLAGEPMPERIWTGSRALLAHGARYHGQPIMFTEVGGFLLRPDLPREQWDRLYQVYASLQSADELADKYADLMEGLAELTFVRGFCYTQLTDIEQEINGLLTYDRRPKVAPEIIAEVHRKLLRRRASG